MRIAQISPLFESVPPKLYGGTERIVHFLTEELVALGHDVTLFASGDSETSARLVPVCDRALRLGKAAEPTAHHLLALEAAFRNPGEFDVIHTHVDYLAYPFARRHPDTPVVATLHGRLDLPELQPLYREYAGIPLVSISDAQRAPLPDAEWVATVHHGLPVSRYPFRARPGGYLAFLGRVSPEKGLLSAIDIALACGMPLRIAAKVDAADKAFFEERVRPRLDHPLIGFLGEIGDERKAEFLGGAAALLFPIEWPEPFGLVMIEAMSCGTPVLARRRGSVPEVMADGITGFTFEMDDEAVALVPRAMGLDRRACREHFEARFAARRMAEDYLAAYRKVTEAASETAAGGNAEDWRPHGGGHQRQREVLHNGQLLPGREAEPGPQTWGDIRGLR
jgi:glycosyltransferase involved in cell wall biosynthesis